MHVDLTSLLIGVALGVIAVRFSKWVQRRRMRKLILARLHEMGNGRKKPDLTAETASLS